MFVKTHRTELKAVTTIPSDYVEKAKQYLRQAEAVGARTHGRKARPTHQGNVAPGRAIKTYQDAPEPTTKHEIKLTLWAAEHFRIAGENFDSAKAYAVAAALCAEDLQDPKQAAELFTEAAIVMEKVDSDFANEYYSKLSCETSILSNASTWDSTK